MLTFYYIINLSLWAPYKYYFIGGVFIVGLNDQMVIIIKDILKKHNIKKAGVFGSYARGEATDSSDLDLVVELAKNDLFELAGLKMDLEEKLNISTDIITYSGLRNFAKKEEFKKAVLDEQVIII